MLIFTQQCVRFKHLELITSCIYVMSARSTTHATEMASILNNLYLHLHAASLLTPQNILPVGHTPYAKTPFSINASPITHRLKKYILRSKWFQQNALKVYCLEFHCQTVFYTQTNELINILSQVLLQSSFHKVVLNELTRSRHHLCPLQSQNCHNRLQNDLKIFILLVVVKVQKESTSLKCFITDQMIH
jgi:hypothetical protein